MSGLFIPGQNDNISKMAQEAGSPPPSFQPQQIPLDQVIVQISAQVAQQVFEQMSAMKNKLELNYFRTSDTAKVPTKAHNNDACFDLYADIQEPVTICPGEIKKIGTGFSTEIPHGYFGTIFARSGLGSKGICPGNCVGIVDESYRGEWIVALVNNSNSSYTINPGDRIAQFTLLPYPEIKLTEVVELSDTDRGNTGFGSSGQ